jgi:hypothetical protein
VELTLIGYWRSEGEPNDEWPDAHDFVDEGWDEVERHMVATYLSSGTVARAYRGWSPCRFCGKHNGSKLYTDGTYAWPEGLAHYIDEHAIRLPRRFVEHAVGRLDAIEEASLNLDWWRTQGPR